jgi:hypothetical protein
VAKGARGLGGFVQVARHLLSHSAGLANPIPVRWVHPVGRPGADPATFVGDLLTRHAKLGFDPGGKARYSNLGFLVLGRSSRLPRAVPSRTMSASRC